MTSNDREKIKESNYCHLYIAIARPKDNKEGSNKHVIRQVIRDEKKDLNDIKARCKAINPDLTYRIYHTVNARDFDKALKLLQHRLIDEGERFKYRIDSLWKTCLLQPSSRAEKKLMFDIDTTDGTTLNSICTSIEEGLDQLGKYNEDLIIICSPNGYHVISDPFDYRDTNEKYKEVTVLTKGGKRSERDFDKLIEFPELSTYATTLTFANEEDRMKYEPGASPTKERTNALEKAHRLGIETWVSCEPVIKPNQTIELIKQTAEYTDLFKIGKANYIPEAKDINWTEFANTVITLLENLDKEYYIKEDLKKYIN